MVLFPNAKINLGLNILGKRPDGYHNIESIMAPVDWSDVLEFIPSVDAETKLFVSGNHIDCPPEKNLVMKAWRLLADDFNITPIDIYLHKNIPDGAGLGGGSADASFMLRGLNTFFELGLTDDELADYASRLGADCAFFCYNRPMLATGIGTRLSPVTIDLSSYTVLVVKPDAHVSTAEAYAGVTPRAADASLREIVAKSPETWSSAGLKNDFENSVFLRFPEIERVKKALVESGAVYAAMSGSGSAVFGIFDKDGLAEEARNKFPEYKSRICQFL